MKNLKCFNLFEGIGSNDIDTLWELKDIFDILEDDWGSNINYFLEDYSHNREFDTKYHYNLNGNLVATVEGQFLRYGLFEMPIYCAYIINNNLSNSDCLEIFNLIAGQIKRVDSVGLKPVLFEIFFSSKVAGYYRKKFTSPELFSQYINHKERLSDLESYYTDIKLEILLKFSRI